MDDTKHWSLISFDGFGFGAALAIAISYHAWHSIPWAIVHGLCSWGYVLYYTIKY